MKHDAHIFVNAQPKSASTFIEGSLRLTLDCPQVRIVSPGINYSQVMPDGVQEFLSRDCVTSHGHLAPLAFNLNLLHTVGLKKFVLTVRDPRDALVSWGHHLERPEAKDKKWHSALMVASGIHSEDYYEKNWEGKLDDLIENFAPILRDWVTGWSEIVSGDSRFDINIVRYEDFTDNPKETIAGIFLWYGLDIPADKIIFPQKSETPHSDIDLATGFRKGKTGSFREELTDRQIEALHGQLGDQILGEFNCQ